MRAKTKEEYLSFIARLILHVRQQSSGPQGGGSADLGDLGMNQPNMQQQQQQRMMMQQQQQQRMQMMQQQQQQQQMMGGHQRPPMSAGGGLL